VCGLIDEILQNDPIYRSFLYSLPGRVWCFKCYSSAVNSRYISAKCKFKTSSNYSFVVTLIPLLFSLACKKKTTISHRNLLDMDVHMISGIEVANGY